MSLTKLSLGGNYDLIHKLFLPRGSLVSDIPAGDRNIEKLFYGVSFAIMYIYVRLSVILKLYDSCKGIAYLQWVHAPLKEAQTPWHL
jgi:hypothetical protein